MSAARRPDLVCFSHLRWGFVFQRPQHLLSRLAARRRVFFVEEPLVDDGPARLKVQTTPEGVTLLVPHLPQDTADQARTVRALLDGFLGQEGIDDFVAWYYTPMALSFTKHLRPRLVVYDCMDELTGFAGAPPEMAFREAELLRRAQLVLTGGQSLFEAKCHKHRNVHLFPSSVDAAHFRKARVLAHDRADQAHIPQPRIGYAGVIDERLDLPLVAAIAAARPEWHLVMLGPVAKIDARDLPAAANVHYLGMKPYSDLPAYMAGWDVGILPFARNDATRFISPTKTPEYLAAGLPVVSTPIRDVVRPYGVSGLVKIAEAAGDFVSALEASLQCDRARHRAHADAFLAAMSWDDTVARMEELIELALVSNEGGAWAPEVA
jgi:glycosyltransferase involved in cell wall biosynthesis